MHPWLACRDRRRAVSDPFCGEPADAAAPTVRDAIAALLDGAAVQVTAS